MKTTRTPKRRIMTGGDIPTSPPPPSTATDWDLWMEKHAAEIRGDEKPRPRAARRPKKRPKR
ncbi:MAG TPA: hypothetical protein VGQ78_08725 [Vicinamibacteria bacterium]|jgi:hypothetical protein|nr:hypothetical protein [Vicinamibacteria bacterium]